jgi:uncharacterized membrane protein
MLWLAVVGLLDAAHLFCGVGRTVRESPRYVLNALTVIGAAFSLYLTAVEAFLLHASAPSASPQRRSW